MTQGWADHGWIELAPSDGREGAIEASKLFYEKLGFAVFAGDQSQIEDRGLSMISEADESSTGPASFMIVDPDGNTIPVDQHV